MGGKNDRGYGQFKVGGKAVGAHRFSYELNIGPTDGMCVCHSCDNPACVNPAHLWLGTKSDNNQDMYAKGRGDKALGMANASAKLTDDDVRKIRGDLRKYSDIAEDYGVTPLTIGNIRRGVYWKHIEDAD